MTCARRLRAIAAALCLGIAGFLANPAGAGSLFLDGVGFGSSAVTMNVDSFQEKKYKTTFPQQYDFSERCHAAE